MQVWRTLNLRTLLQSRKTMKKQPSCNANENSRYLQNRVLTCDSNLRGKERRRHTRIRHKDLMVPPNRCAITKDPERWNLPLWRNKTQQSFFLSTSCNGILTFSITLNLWCPTNRQTHCWELRKSQPRNLYAPTPISGSSKPYNQNEGERLNYRWRVRNHQTHRWFHRRTSKSRQENTGC